MNITIVTPVYNGGASLNGLYLNVSPLLNERIDWIIVNDCSKDDTLSILEKISTNNDFINYHTMFKNSGPSKARRKGAELSSKEYIFFLDCDDFIDANNFIDFVSYANSNPMDFYYSPLLVISDKSQFYKNPKFSVKESIKYVNNPLGFIRYSFPQPSSLMVNRDFFINNDRENELLWGEDFLMYLCLAKYGSGVRWSSPVSCYLINGDGRGSKLSLKYRLVLFLSLIKESVNKNKVPTSILYSLYLLMRHITSFLYKTVSYKLKK